MITYSLNYGTTEECKATRQRLKDLVKAGFKEMVEEVEQGPYFIVVKASFDSDFMENWFKDACIVAVRSTAY